MICQQIFSILASAIFLLKILLKSPSKSSCTTTVRGWTTKSRTTKFYADNTVISGKLCGPFNLCWCWDEVRQGLAAEVSTLVWLPRAGCALLWTASESELLCFSSFAFHVGLQTAECLCHLIFVSVCTVTNRTRNHDRILHTCDKKKDLSDFGCFHFLFKINFFCSGVGVWRKQWEVWSVKCEVWRKQWEVRSVKCGVWSLSLECEARSVKCEVWSVKEAVGSVKCEVRSVKCEVWSVKFQVRSAKSAVWSVECEDFASSLAEKIKRLSREGHGRDKVSLNYRSFMFGKLPPPACPGLCY